MAVVSGGVARALDILDINLGLLNTYAPLAFTDSLIALAGPVERVDFFGAGLGLDANDNVTGTVTAILSTRYGQPWLAVTGIAVPAMQLDHWITFGLTSTALQIILGGADQMRGTPFGDRLQAFLGHDWLNGLDGNDTLDGGDGNDTVDGGGGADSLAGGYGSDSYVIDHAGDVAWDIGGMPGEVDTALASVSWVLPASIESLVLTGAAGAGTGNALGNALTGNGYNNTLDGAGGDDAIEAGNGADLVVGRTGNDTVQGGAGGDAIDGNEGNDLLSGGGEGDVIFGRAGNDTIDGGFDNDILMGEEGLEIGTGNDVIAGGWGTDQLNGGAGTDSLYGGGGIDMITGGTGDDLIAGMGGVDAIDPGAGADTLIYFAIADFYGDDAAADYLVGIEAGVDVFDLRQLLDSLGAPDGAPAALRAAGWFRVVQQGGDALLQLDGNGGGDGYATAALMIGVTAAGVTDAMFLT